MTKYLNVRCRAFSCEGVRMNRIAVDGDTVRVYDSVAGCYVTLHSLSKRTQARILKMAKEISNEAK
jgi:hypothetical protein